MPTETSLPSTRHALREIEEGHRPFPENVIPYGIMQPGDWEKEFITPPSIPIGATREEIAVATSTAQLNALKKALAFTSRAAVSIEIASRLPTSPYTSTPDLLVTSDFLQLELLHRLQSVNNTVQAYAKQMQTDTYAIQANSLLAHTLQQLVPFDTRYEQGNVQMIKDHILHTAAQGLVRNEGTIDKFFTPLLVALQARYETMHGTPPTMDMFQVMVDTSLRVLGRGTKLTAHENRTYLKLLALHLKALPPMLRKLLINEKKAIYNPFHRSNFREDQAGLIFDPRVEEIVEQALEDLAEGFEEEYGVTRRSFIRGCPAADRLSREFQNSDLDLIHAAMSAIVGLPPKNQQEVEEELS